MGGLKIFYFISIFLVLQVDIQFTLCWWIRHCSLFIVQGVFLSPIAGAPSGALSGQSRRWFLSSRKINNKHFQAKFCNWFCGWGRPRRRSSTSTSSSSPSSMPPSPSPTGSLLSSISTSRVQYLVHPYLMPLTLRRATKWLAVRLQPKKLPLPSHIVWTMQLLNLKSFICYLLN